MCARGISDESRAEPPADVKPRLKLAGRSRTCSGVRPSIAPGDCGEWHLVSHMLISMKEKMEVFYCGIGSGSSHAIS